MGGSILNFLPFVLLIVIMYLFLFRPQQKRVQEHQRLVRSLEVGDEVITSSGIFGTITRLDDDRVELELSGGGRLEMLKTSVMRRAGDEPTPRNETPDEIEDESLE